MSRKVQAFTIIELLAVISIIAVLAAMLLPSLSRARAKSRAVVCLTHLRELGAGWQMYADENDDVLVPGRMGELLGGTDNPANFYDVGNGRKYRPRWAALLGAMVDIHAFSDSQMNDPVQVKNDRLDYDNPVYQCPTEPRWVDERNHGYGYNHQFLGNARITAAGRFYNYPIKRHRIKASSGTVVAADSLGTAAAFVEFDRTGYVSDGTQNSGMANHGYSLDPPRLTEDSDRGTGEEDSPRTAVDPRHQGNVNVVFADNHGESKKPYDLGYRMNGRKAFVNQPAEDAEVGGGGGGDVSASAFSPGSDRQTAYISLGAEPAEQIDWAHNRLFSGSGRDKDPPAISREP